MRKLYIVLGALLTLHVAFLFVRPSGAEQVDTTEGFDVGIVFDLGGRGDKSFNDGAYAGAERAAKELGARVRFIEPGEGSDREAGLRLLAAEGMDLVVGVGFIFTDDLTQLAKEYPNVRFAGVDYVLAVDDKGEVIALPENLAALKFREEEGSFLVGALAALAGKSNKVGFVGGMDFPLIHKFEAGYRAGVKHVCPTCEVLAQYAGVTPEAFRNPGRGKELALSQYQQGVNIIYHASGSTGLGVFEAGYRAGVKAVCPTCEVIAQYAGVTPEAFRNPGRGQEIGLSQFQSGVNVIFHASGSTGLGVFEAARRRGKLAIGVDADQYSEAPGYILTSMVKGVDQAVFDAIRQVKDGSFKGGIFQLGLKEKGVDYVYDGNNRSLIPDSVRARVEALRREIIAGRITVPSTK